MASSGEDLLSVFYTRDYNEGFTKVSTAEKPMVESGGNPEVSNSRKPLAPETSCCARLGNAAREAQALCSSVQGPAEMGVPLRATLAQGQQKGITYGRTLITEMYAIDVKTTIFPSEVNLKIIDFHKVLELSNGRKGLLILCKIVSSGLSPCLPLWMNTHTYSFFFFF